MSRRRYTANVAGRGTSNWADNPKPQPKAFEGHSDGFTCCGYAPLIDTSGLVDCVDISTHGGENYIVNRLTAAGLQESGLWPKAADLSDALAAALKQEIAATSRSDPELSRKLKLVLDTLSSFGSDFLAKLAAELLKNLGH